MFIERRLCDSYLIIFRRRFSTLIKDGEIMTASLPDLSSKSARSDFWRRYGRRPSSFPADTTERPAAARTAWIWVIVPGRP